MQQRVEGGDAGGVTLIPDRHAATALVIVITRRATGEEFGRIDIGGANLRDPVALTLGGRLYNGLAPFRSGREDIGDVLGLIVGSGANF